MMISWARGMSSSDVRRFVEYGSLSIDSCRSIPEKDPIPQTYERIPEGEIGECWPMTGAPSNCTSEVMDPERIASLLRASWTW